MHTTITPSGLQRRAGYAQVHDELLLTEAMASTVTSVAVFAEILLRSPRNLFIFIIKKYVYRIKVS